MMSNYAEENREWVDDLFGGSRSESIDLKPELQDIIRYRPDTDKQKAILNAWHDVGEGNRTNWSKIAEVANQNLPEDAPQTSANWAERVIKRSIGNDDVFQDLTNRQQLAVDVLAKYGSDKSPSKLSQIHDDFPSLSLLSRARDTWPDIIRAREDIVRDKGLVEAYGLGSSEQNQPGDQQSGIDRFNGVSYNLDTYHIVHPNGRLVCGNEFGPDPKLEAGVDEIDGKLGLSLCENCRRHFEVGPWAGMSMREMRERLVEEDWFNGSEQRTASYLSRDEMAQIMRRLFGEPEGN